MRILNNFQWFYCNCCLNFAKTSQLSLTLTLQFTNVKCRLQTMKIWWYYYGMQNQDVLIVWLVRFQKFFLNYSLAIQIFSLNWRGNKLWINFARMLFLFFVIVRKRKRSHWLMLITPIEVYCHKFGFCNWNYTLRKSSWCTNTLKLVALFKKLKLGNSQMKISKILNRELACTIILYFISLILTRSVQDYYFLTLTLPSKKKSGLIWTVFWVVTWKTKILKKLAKQK